jgi:hypothetical protein
MSSIYIFVFLEAPVIIFCNFFFLFFYNHYIRFLAEIRMHLSISNDQSVYIFVNGNVIPQAAASLSQVRPGFF